MRQRTLREVLALELDPVPPVEQPKMTEATRERLTNTLAKYKKGGESSK